MESFTTRRISCKGKLALAVGLILGPNYVHGQVNSWLGTLNVWQNPNNWSTLLVPTQNQIQRIQATSIGVGTTIFWRSGSSGSVQAGTIELIANYGTFANGSGVSSSTVNFGPSAGFDASRTVTIGQQNVDMTFDIPGIFHARLDANRSMNLNPKIVGDGSLVFSKLPSAGSGNFFFNIGSLLEATGTVTVFRVLRLGRPETVTRFLIP